MDKTPSNETRHGGERPGISVEFFTEGKGGSEANPDKNEDVAAYNEHGMVLADGSTTKDKSLAARFEAAFGGKSGGRVAAEIIAQTALDSGLDGRELVDYISGNLRALYDDKFPDAIDPDGNLKKEMCMAATFVLVRYDNKANEAVITRVGDTAARITLHDGRQIVLRDEREIDKKDAADRAAAIERELASGTPEPEAIKKGREAILPSLNKQAGSYWNNPDSKYGFGYVTGDFIPDKFIGVTHVPLEAVRSIEVISDGYTYGPEEEWPTDVTIDSWNSYIAGVHAQDPNKFKAYPATKPNDDRGILIARL